MERKTLSELKVGIFVLIAVTILAVAIFTIGTQVGLFEDTFVAKTYLNNVSGLKPGDIVLMAGVEAGNVMEVRVTKPSETIVSPVNQRSMELGAALSERIKQLEAEIPNNQAQLAELNRQYAEAIERFSPESRQARDLERRVRAKQTSVDNQLSEIEEAREEVERLRGSIQNIVVYMEIKEEYRDWIKRDSNISLGSIGLLGDKYIDVSLGRTNLPPIVEEEPVDTWLGKDEREVVVVTGTAQATFQELITGADDVLANFETLSRKLQNIMDQFERGEGSVGKFFNDPSFYNNLNAAVVGAQQSTEEAMRLMQEVTRGTGTVPLLIREREVYDRMNAAIGSLEEMMTQIEKGQGSLGKLVNDPALYESSNQVVRNIQGITKRMDSGEGTLGKLSTDEQLYHDLRRSVDQLGRFMADIEAGKGTLGKLAQDEQLYQNLNKVSSEVVKLIYDFRQNPRKFLTVKFEIF